MVSEAIRDPAKDDLLTPQNSAFIIIDYQPVQVNSIASMDRQILEQAGAKLISVPQLFCELQRDWKRAETVPAFINLFIETGGTAGIQFSYDKQG